MRGLDADERAMLLVSVSEPEPGVDTDVTPEEADVAERLVTRGLCVWRRIQWEDEYFWYDDEFLCITETGRSMLLWDAMAKGNVT